MVEKERRQSRDMETLTEQEYLMSGHQSPAKTSSDSKAATSSAADTATDEDDPFFGMP